MSSYEIRLKPSTTVFPIGEWIFISHQSGKCKVPIDMEDEVRDICRGISTKNLTLGHRNLVRILRERGLLDEHIRTPREISPRFERLISYLARFEPKQDRASSFGKLHNTRVCVVGLGGLGTWMVQSLVMLGIRRLILIDGDVIEISNFNRQLFWREEDIGRAKVEVVIERLHQWDPSLEIESHCQYITSSDVVRHILFESKPDLTISCADQPLWYIRRWINEACISLNIPFVVVAGSKVGPLVVPGQTACIECQWMQVKRDYPQYERDLNACLSIPQPVRGSIVSEPMSTVGAASQDIFRFVTGVELPRSMGAELVLSNASSELHPITKDPSCSVCGNLPMKGGDLTHGCTHGKRADRS